MTSQAALVNIQRVSKDCALSEVTRDGLDTAECLGNYGKLFVLCVVPVAMPALLLRPKLCRNAVPDVLQV